MQSPKMNTRFYDANAARKASLMIPSSTQNKDKLRRNIFKVKDPERFDKLLKIL